MAVYGKPGSNRLNLTANGGASLIGEVYNPFNHANFTAFSATLSPTNAATTAGFGQPTAAEIARLGQLAFRVGF